MSRSDLRIPTSNTAAVILPITEAAELLRQDPDRALSQMLSAYGGLLFSVVRGILPASPQEEIEECVSDALLYVFEHRQRLDFTKGSVKAYLCATAKNLAYDKLRELRRRQTHEQPTDKLPDGIAPSAEELALLNTDRDALIDAIRALGEPDTRILICRYYLNLRSAEIAEIVGLKQNTVDQRARRALRKLARHFKKGETHV